MVGTHSHNMQFLSGALFVNRPVLRSKQNHASVIQAEETCLLSRHVGFRLPPDALRKSETAYIPGS